MAYEFIEFVKMVNAYRQTFSLVYLTLPNQAVVDILTIVTKTLSKYLQYH